MFKAARYCVRLISLGVACALVTGCHGSDTSRSDAGADLGSNTTDGGVIDAAVTDLGASDGNAADLGTTSDATTTDGAVADGAALSDAGMDASTADATVDAASDATTADAGHFPIVRACPSLDGGPPNGECVFPSVSTTGRYVAFASSATNLTSDVFTGPSGPHHFYVRDTVSNTTELVSFNVTGAPSSTPYNPVPPSISGDGRYVLFGIPANEWDSVNFDSPNPLLMIVHDRQMHTSRVVSQKASGEYYDGNGVTLSGDGRHFVIATTYTLTSSMLTLDQEEVFVRDLAGDGDAITQVSIAPDGTPGFGNSSDFGDIAISNDGNRVVFTSNANNFLTGAADAGEPTWMKHCFLRDIMASTTVRIDVATSGTTGDWPYGECSWVKISGDGNFVIFSSGANNIVDGDTNTNDDLFLYNVSSHAVSRISLSDSGAQISDSAPVVTATNVREIDVTDDGSSSIFLSNSRSYISGDTSTGGREGFLRDTVHNHTYRFTLRPDASEFSGSEAAFIPRISGDGSTIIFTSGGYNIFPDSHSGYEIFFVPRTAF